MSLTLLPVGGSNRGKIVEMRRYQDFTLQESNMKSTGLAHARSPDETRGLRALKLKAAGRTVAGHLCNFAPIEIFDSVRKAGGRA